MNHKVFPDFKTHARTNTGHRRHGQDVLVYTIFGEKRLTAEIYFVCYSPTTLTRDEKHLDETYFKLVRLRNSGISLTIF